MQIESTPFSSSLTNFSDELLLKIFGYMPYEDRVRASQVCSLFQRVANDLSLLDTLSESGKGKALLRSVRTHNPEATRALLKLRRPIPTEMYDKACMEAAEKGYTEQLVSLFAARSAKTGVRAHLLTAASIRADMIHWILTAKLHRYHETASTLLRLWQNSRNLSGVPFVNTDLLRPLLKVLFSKGDANDREWMESCADTVDFILSELQITSFTEMLRVLVAEDQLEITRLLLMKREEYRLHTLSHREALRYVRRIEFAELLVPEWFRRVEAHHAPALSLDPRYIRRLSAEGPLNNFDEAVVYALKARNQEALEALLTTPHNSLQEDTRFLCLEYFSEIDHLSQLALFYGLPKNASCISEGRRLFNQNPELAFYYLDRIKPEESDYQEAQYRIGFYYIYTKGLNPLCGLRLLEQIPRGSPWHAQARYNLGEYYALGNAPFHLPVNGSPAEVALNYLNEVGEGAEAYAAAQCLVVKLRITEKSVFSRDLALQAFTRIPRESPYYNSAFELLQRLSLYFPSRER